MQKHFPVIIVFFFSLILLGEAATSSLLSNEKSYPIGNYRLISPKKLPYNDGKLGMLFLRLGSGGTFWREVGTRQCSTPSCPISRIEASGRYELTQNDGMSLIQFFDSYGIFLDSWGYVFIGNELRLWIEKEGSSGFNFANTGTIKNLERWYEDLNLVESDNGSDVTIEVGQALAVQLPVGSGGRWETVGPIDSLLRHNVTLLDGPTSSVPEGMRRTVFIAAHHSLGHRMLKMQYIGQDGLPDPQKTFQASVNVTGRTAIVEPSCAYEECLWLAYNDKYSENHIKTNQAVIINLPNRSKCRLPGKNYSTSKWRKLAVSAWYDNQPGDDIFSYQFVWRPNSSETGKQRITCSTKSWGTVYFNFNVTSDK